MQKVDGARVYTGDAGIRGGPRECRRSLQPVGTVSYTPAGRTINVSNGGFRQAISEWVFSPLQGITFGDWTRLVANRRLSVEPRYVPRMVWTGVGAAINSIQARLERRRYRRQIAEANVHSPLFVLGQYRSGTTHLHNLLAADRRFGFVNYYQATFPHTFLTTESMGSRLGAAFSMRRRPYDEVALGLDEPAEDELSLCSLTFLSYHMCWHFPSAADHYRRYVTFEEVEPVERDRWKAAFTQMVRKLSVKHEKPLVFKSPCHTARIPMLLELFPDARFVHIHRNPFEVFQSTRKMESKVGPLFQFERRDPATIDEHVLWRYKATYDAYLAHRERIPRGRLVEVSYADLVGDTVGTLRNIYDGLDLPDFEIARPAIETYLSSLKSYRVNRYSSLDSGTARRIVGEWGRFFEEWGYSA